MFYPSNHTGLLNLTFLDIFCVFFVCALQITISGGSFHRYMSIALNFMILFSKMAWRLRFTVFETSVLILHRKVGGDKNMHQLKHEFLYE